MRQLNTSYKQVIQGLFITVIGLVLLVKLRPYFFTGAQRTSDRDFSFHFPNTIHKLLPLPVIHQTLYKQIQNEIEGRYDVTKLPSVVSILSTKNQSKSYEKEVNLTKVGKEEVRLAEKKANKADRVIGQAAFAGNPLVLHILPVSIAERTKAFCLDGSPPAYYLRPGNSTSSRHWHIHLPGGAWCGDAADCASRSATVLGSSAATPPTWPYAHGALDDDCDSNPDLCGWSLAVLQYCDGGSFLGNRSTDVVHQGQTLHMRGAAVFQALIEHLITLGLGAATQVLLSGNSAGGLGAMAHADWLAGRLGAGADMLKVIIDGSMFVDVPDVHGKRIMGEILKDFYNFHSVKDSRSAQDCTEKRRAQGLEEWQCVLPEVLQPFIKTPQFYDNSIFDSWQRHAVLGVPCSAFECPNDSTDTIFRAKDTIQRFTEQIISSKKNGVFLTACPRHGLLPRSEFDCKELGNPPLREALGAWLRGKPIFTFRDWNISITEALQTCDELQFSCNKSF